MDEMFSELEQKIKDLINQQAQLKQVNTFLNASQSVLTEKNDYLLIKNQQTISHIQNLINKLKLIEKQL